MNESCLLGNRIQNLQKKKKLNKDEVNSCFVPCYCLLFITIRYEKNHKSRTENFDDDIVVEEVVSQR